VDLDGDFGELGKRLVGDHETREFLRSVITVRVVALGRTSVRYEFVLRRGGEDCARGQVVAAPLSGAAGNPVPWPNPYRDLLTTAGRQPG
jgi:Predicted thioesterase